MYFLSNDVGMGSSLLSICKTFSIPQFEDFEEANFICFGKLNG
jgi:hypothetical protein